MKKWLTRVGHFLNNEEGPTAVEYAVMLALIIAVCFAAISSLGSNTNNSFANAKLNSTLISGGT